MNRNRSRDALSTYGWAANLKSVTKTKKYIHLLIQIRNYLGRKTKNSSSCSQWDQFHYKAAQLYIYLYKLGMIWAEKAKTVPHAHNGINFITKRLKSNLISRKWICISFMMQKIRGWLTYFSRLSAGGESLNLLIQNKWIPMHQQMALLVIYVQLSIFVSISVRGMLVFVRWEFRLFLVNKVLSLSLSFYECYSIETAKNFPVYVLVIRGWMRRLFVSPEHGRAALHVVFRCRVR